MGYYEKNISSFLLFVRLKHNIFTEGSFLEVYKFEFFNEWKIFLTSIKILFKEKSQPKLIINEVKFTRN